MLLVLAIDLLLIACAQEDVLDKIESTRLLLLPNSTKAAAVVGKVKGKGKKVKGKAAAAAAEAEAAAAAAAAAGEGAEGEAVPAEGGQAVAEGTERGPHPAATAKAGPSAFRCPFAMLMEQVEHTPDFQQHMQHIYGAEGSASAPPARPAAAAATACPHPLPSGSGSGSGGGCPFSAMQRSG